MCRISHGCRRWQRNDEVIRLLERCSVTLNGNELSTSAELARPQCIIFVVTLLLHGNLWRAAQQYVQRACLDEREVGNVPSLSETLLPSLFAPLLPRPSHASMDTFLASNTQLLNTYMSRIVCITPYHESRLTDPSAITSQSWPPRTNGTQVNSTFRPN